MRQIKFLTKRERRELALLMESGRFAGRLPLSVLRSEVFGGRQFEIAQALRAKSPRAAISTLASCAGTATYADAVRRPEGLSPGATNRHPPAKDASMTTMENPVIERIRKDIEHNQVVLYMKGTPVFPQCGFSATVVQVLTNLGVRFKGIDVLMDPSLRQGIKEFSNWPTVPQLYVGGEFVGGCDIIREMYETGELTELLNSRGVEAAPQA